MATLYVLEFAELAKDNVGNTIPVGFYDDSARDQTVSISGTSATSNGFGNKTHFVRVHTDVACHVKIKSSAKPATTSHARMAADQTEYFGVRPGHFLTVIQA